MNTPPTVVIVGCGYVGLRLAQQLTSTHTVYGLIRTPQKAAVLRAAQVEPIITDLDTHPILTAAWLHNSTLFYFAPPPKEGDSDARLYHFLNGLQTKPAHFIYLSTTGVYGGTDNVEVTESTAINPLSSRARRRVSAEDITRIWCTEKGVRRVVFRVPAIYGPGRMPLQRLRNREPCIRIQEASIVNRIHVDDLVQACIAALRNTTAQGVYNISDGNAYTLTDYLNYVAAAAHLPPPPQISLDEAQLTFTPERLSFLDNAQRVSNQRMCEELGVQLRFADLQSGIRASLEEEARTHSKSSTSG